MREMLKAEGPIGEKAAQLDGLTLAYMGDAVYEILVRDYLLSRHSAKPGKLHKMATDLVSASAQFAAYKKISDQLTEKEAAIFARGRNAKTGVGKRNDPLTHCHATGIEALFGYLYLAGEEERLLFLFAEMMKEEKTEEE